MLVVLDVVFRDAQLPRGLSGVDVQLDVVRGQLRLMLLALPGSFWVDPKSGRSSIDGHPTFPEEVMQFGRRDVDVLAGLELLPIDNDRNMRVLIHNDEAL